MAKRKFYLTGYEWLGLAIMALATLWIWRSPPTTPDEWWDWLFNIEIGWGISPTRALLILAIYVSFLIIRNHRRQVPHDFFAGSVAVTGVSILAFAPESTARKAGMQKGDVIIEYASERDVTLEKMSTIVAKGGPESGQVSVVFVRDGRQYSQTLPSGPLGISAMNTTINVPIRLQWNSGEDFRGHHT